MKRVTWIAVGFVLLLSAAHAAPREACVYSGTNGALTQVMGRESIPPQFRATAKCFAAAARSQEELAAPAEIKLSGAQRSDTFVTAIGPMRLRWPRVVESAFGRTPQRAVAEAAAAVSRTLKKPGFPPELRSLNLPWEIVFMDEDLPEQQIPWYLVTNCHPAWMTPEANLYFVTQRIVAGCGTAQPKRGAVADATLAPILLHEIGHALEHRLLKGRGGGDRRRSEGFATWFEQYAADQMPLLPRGSVAAEHLALARKSVARGDPLFGFQGSAEDYMRAALPFIAIEKRRGVAGVMKVYEVMRSERLPFPQAIDRALGWNQKQLVEEIERVLR